MIQRSDSKRAVRGLWPAIVFLTAGVVFGCGDSNVASPDGPRTIKFLFAEFLWPDGTPVRFQIDHPETTSVPVIEYVAPPGDPLFADPVLAVDSLRIESDSLFFKASSMAGDELFRVRVRRSSFILVGEALFPDSSEAAVLRGLTCLVEPGSGRQEPFPGQVEQIAFPIRFEAPAYPESLVSAGVEGTVRTLVQVGSCGSVLDVEITKNEHPDLDSLTVQSIRGWLFYPARVNAFDYVALEQFLSIHYELPDGDGSPVVEVQNGG